MFDTAEHLAELRELPTEELEHAYAQLDALEGAVRAQRLLVLAVLDERDVGRGDGAADTANWVAVTSRVTLGTARAVTRTPGRLANQPAIAAVASEGRLSSCCCVPATTGTCTSTAGPSPATPPGHTPSRCAPHSAA